VTGNRISGGWRVERVDGEAASIARHRAAAAGITVGDWVARAISEAARRGAVRRRVMGPVAVASNVILPPAPRAASEPPASATASCSPPALSPETMDLLRAVVGPESVTPVVRSAAVTRGRFGPRASRLHIVRRCAATLLLAAIVGAVPWNRPGLFERGLTDDASTASALSRIASAAGGAARRVLAETGRTAPVARNGVPASPTTMPIAWYRKAARDGQPVAQFVLAALYLRGTGVVRDAAEAARLYRRAAAAGLAAAQYALGILYRDGIGTARDAGAAYAWLTRAATAGHRPAAAALRALGPRMSRAERSAAARRLARPGPSPIK